MVTVEQRPRGKTSGLLRSVRCFRKHLTKSGVVRTERKPKGESLSFSFRVSPNGFFLCTRLPRSVGRHGKLGVRST